MYKEHSRFRACFVSFSALGSTFSPLSFPLSYSCLNIFLVADAWGKLQSGILSGNLVALGDFDQCIAVKHKISPHHEIEGQYCLMQILFEVTAVNISNHIGFGMNVFGKYGAENEHILIPEDVNNTQHPRLLLA